MPQDTGAAVGAQALEVAVLGRQPSVEHLDDSFGLVTEMVAVGSPRRSTLRSTRRGT